MTNQDPMDCFSSGTGDMSTPGTPEHELLYRAGSSGLGYAGIPDASPHWYCSCGRWIKYRDAQGRPFREAAAKHHRRHAQGEVRV